jgi:leucyl aminopeptidase
MQSVFETASAAPAIPIIFATKASWDAIRDGLAATARQFALANDFAANA